ncbi:hypothetical protein [Fundidesulfovibrio agrisoli]|uniref:hypothetical protein n=1 Tax=Fundidesulfovibrio agrisoli TaxID=2922717 RepID=UPI001FAC1BBD|nr:hypothetical protein [Fundidesulfovibrio agrisoli]
MLQTLLKLFRRTPAYAPGAASGVGDEALAHRLATMLLPEAVPQLKHAEARPAVLMDPALRAIGHMRGLVGSLGQPVLLTREAFFKEPRVNAMFTSAEQLQGFVRDQASLRSFFGEASRETARILLTATPVTRGQFGSEVQGEVIQRDVLQRGLTFESHRCPLVAQDDDAFSESVVAALMDLYAAKIGEMLLDLESRRAECEHQAKALGCKIKILEINTKSIGGMFSDKSDEAAKLASARELRASFEAELAGLRQRLQDPEAYSREVAGALSNPAEILSGRSTAFRLDEYGIIHDLADASVGNVVEFSEFTLETRTRVALIADVPRAALES